MRKYHSAIVMAGLFSVSAQVLAQKYEVYDLGDLEGDTIAAYDINVAGMVIGSANGPLTTDEDGSEIRAFNWHAFCWQNGIVTDLGALDGGDSYGNALNSTGDMVGASYLITEPATDDDDAVESLRAIYLPYGADEYTVLPLPTQATSAMRAVDIDDTGAIVGYLYAEMSEDAYANRGFIWQPMSNITQVVGTLEDDGSSYLRSVNAVRQQAVGNASYDGYPRAIRLDLAMPDALTDLGTLGGNSSQASAINDAGQIVGWSTTTDDARNEGFFLEASTGSVMQSIGQLDSLFSYSKATDINNAGVIVGSAQASSGTVLYHAVLYDTSAAVPALIDLNTRIDCAADVDERWVLTEATAINDLGQIVGYGARGGETRAFLLIPSNDNSAVTSCDEADAAAFEDESGSGGMTATLAMSLFMLGGYRFRRRVMPERAQHSA